MAMAATAAAELMMVGVFLGAREAACAAALAMILFALCRLAGRAWPGVTRFGWAACLSVATLTTIVALGSLLWLESRMIEYDAITALVVCGVAVAAGAVVSRLIALPVGTRA